MPYVYILKSQKDRNLYVGATSDVRKRFDEHNRGRVKSTRNRRPLVLVYKEEYRTLSEARKREWYLKHHPTGQQLKKKLIMGR
ncbi:MAG: GIY-YIG nuclease family protein [Patescibacteria group bacterium]